MNESTRGDRFMANDGRLVVYVDNNKLVVSLDSNHVVIDSGHIIIDSGLINIANDSLTVVMQKGTPAYSNVAVANTTTPALAENANRKRAIFYNAGANVVFLKSGAAAALTSIPLLPAVGIPFIDDFSIQAWNAITALGGGDLRIIEIS